MESVNLEDEPEHPPLHQTRAPQPAQPSAFEGQARQTQKSISLVEAAKPNFHIVVGDPHKVGDLTSAHTEYLVTTQVINVDPSEGKLSLTGVKDKLQSVSQPRLHRVATVP